MRVTSTGIENGIIADRFGSKGEHFRNGMPIYSLPFEIGDAPDDAVAFAVIFDDHDAVPVYGFTWLHWLISDLRRTSLKENASVNDKDLIQGVNSCHSCASDLSLEDATGYGGPAPPNCTHKYDLKVFALDKELSLKSGFRLNDLMHAMEGHVICHAKVSGLYSPR